MTTRPGHFVRVYDHEDLYDYIIQYRVENNGHTPTRQQFHRDWGMSTNTASHALKQMEETHGVRRRKKQRAGIITPGEFVPELDWLANLYPHIELPEQLVLQYLQDKGYFKIKYRTEIKESHSETKESHPGTKESHSGTKESQGGTHNT